MSLNGNKAGVLIQGLSPFLVASDPHLFNTVRAEIPGAMHRRC